MTDVLCIGATGMLAGCVRSLIADGNQADCIARTQSSLDRLRDSLAPSDRDRLITHRCDYRDTQALAQILAEMNPAAAICWIHSPAEPVLEAIRAKLLGIDLLQVVGSATTIPSSSSSYADRFVKLGIVIEGDRSRWLTNDEISSGVYSAFRSNERESIVGMIEPWDMRP